MCLIVYLWHIFSIYIFYLKSHHKYELWTTIYNYVTGWPRLVTANLNCNFAYLYWEGCMICSIYCGNFWVTQYAFARLDFFLSDWLKTYWFAVQNSIHSIVVCFHINVILSDVLCNPSCRFIRLRLRHSISINAYVSCFDLSLIDLWFVRFVLFAASVTRSTH